MCTHHGLETPAPLWLDVHADQGKASHATALVTNSNEASPEQERCQSSAGLKGG